MSAAQPTARLSADKIYDNETFQLTLNNAGGDGEPIDLDVLERDFEILSRSQNNSINIVNGQINRNNEWVYTLAAKRTGQLTIPSIRFAQGQTQPLTIEVLKVDPQAAARGEVDAFIEVTVEPETVYVQGQIALTVQLFFATPLQQGSLPDPQPTNAVVERLGEDTSYETLRGGRRYQVIERRYAVFPQHSGAFTVPAIRFQGRVAAATQQRSRRDPFFGISPFDQMGQRSKQIMLQAEPVTVEVMAKPASAQGQWWLPAQSFELSESWPQEPPQFRVGEPITRTITMTAKGLTAAQLPQLPLINSPQLSVYPDQPVIENHVEAPWVVATRQEKVALVPAQQGVLTLPEVAIPWWDSIANKARVARLPARQIEVLPSLRAQSATPQATADERIDAANSAGDDDSVAAESPVVVPNVVGGRLSAWFDWWPWLALLFLTAWLVTLLAWWRERARRLVALHRGHHHSQQSAKARTLSQTSREAVRALQQACNDNRAAAARDALLHWAVAEQRLAAPGSLGELARQFDDSAVVNAVMALDRSLYADTTGQQWQGAGFWSLISPCLKARPESAESATDPLRALYPVGSS
ncbi:MAG: protein BatD [Gammaproteobacteria bacterium]|nr:protein BatD [Gammaproteobacteria bacterium]